MKANMTIDPVGIVKNAQFNGWTAYQLARCFIGMDTNTAYDLLKVKYESSIRTLLGLPPEDKS